MGCGYLVRDPTVARKSVTVPPVDGVRITSMTVFSGRLSPCPDAFDSPLPTNGPPISATYEVTNAGAETYTYTIGFSFIAVSDRGGDSRYVTVSAVAPGKTVRGTVVMGMEDPDDCPVVRVKVDEVIKVPTAEAPPEPGECPRSGLRLTAADGTAASGLRVRRIQLENCGTRDYPLEGYPLLELLDDDRSPIDGVQILHGSGGIVFPTPEFDAPARPLVLKPGERALSALMWRNLTEIGPAAINVPFVRVRARQSADPVTFTFGLDLGTTGKLAVAPWTPAPA